MASIVSAAVLGCGGDSETGGNGAAGPGSGGAGPSSAASTGGAGGGGGAGGMATGGTGGTGGMGTGGGGTIPDPGNTMGGEWPDTEPNDDPSHAVPVGVLQGSLWMGFTDPPNAISSPTDKDYFVFKTGDAASLTVNLQICWSFAGNLLDMSLYEVVGGKQGALVKSSASTASGCETLMTGAEGPMLLKPATVYLLEVAAAPGLNLGGDPGLYSA